MISLPVFLRGGTKFQGPPEPKKAKCPLQAVRNTMKALRNIKITWTEPPARQLISARGPLISPKVKMSTLLSHNLIWKRILQLLKKNLEAKSQIALQRLRRNIFFTN